MLKALKYLIKAYGLNCLFISKSASRLIESIIEENMTGQEVTVTD